MTEKTHASTITPSVTAVSLLDSLDNPVHDVARVDRDNAEGALAEAMGFLADRQAEPPLAEKRQPPAIDGDVCHPVPVDHEGRKRRT